MNNENNKANFTCVGVKVSELAQLSM